MQELETVLYGIKVDPQQLIEYLKQKTAEDREILRLHPNVYRDAKLLMQGQLITNAELLIANTDHNF